MTDNPPHLNEELFVLSLVDVQALSPENRAHLDECASCAAKRAAMLANLEGLGQTAAKFSPGAPKPMAWRTEGIRAKRPFLSVPRPLYALAGAMAVLVLALVLIPGSGIRPFHTPGGGSPDTRESYELAEVYLPSEYLLVENEFSDIPGSGIINFSDTLEEEIYNMANAYLPSDYMYMAGESQIGSSQPPPGTQAAGVIGTPITFPTRIKGAMV